MLTDWSNFRQWILDKIIVVEKVLGINYIAANDITSGEISSQQFNERLKLKLDHIFFEEWIGLYQINNKYEFLGRFITSISTLHDNLYGMDKKQDIPIKMPIKIKKLQFKLSLEKKLREINRLRNDIIHKRMKEQEINQLLGRYFSKIRESYFLLLVQLANKQIFFVANQEKIENVADYTEEARDYIIKTYFTSFSPSDLKKIIEIF